MAGSMAVQKNLAAVVEPPSPRSSLGYASSRNRIRAASREIKGNTMSVASAYSLSAPDELRELPRAAAPCRRHTIPMLPGPGDEAADETLMARVARGDRQALRLLFGRYQLAVYRFALRLVGNSATAEDIVSEVFLELWRRAARFEGRSRLSTWILAIARNKAVSVMRGRIDAPLDDAMAQAIPDRAGTAEETLDASQRSAVLCRCLAQLSAAHREIIDLVYYHEKSVDEVATIVGIPAATVKTRMFYARRQLAEHLRAAGVETVLS
jgi:RNA polymerase sigma-70 factor (ECF subfamily)